MWKDILKSDEQVLRNFLAETAKKYEGKRYNVVVINPQIWKRKEICKYTMPLKLYIRNREIESVGWEYFEGILCRRNYQGESGVYYIDIEKFKKF